jgi:hypothetical protein
VGGEDDTRDDQKVPAIIWRGRQAASTDLATGHRGGHAHAVVAEQLTHTRAQLAVLEQARPGRPDARTLDNYTVAETLRIYGQLAADYRGLFAKQGRRWQLETTADTTARHAVDAYTELRG